ncbi:MAG TPA: ribulose-phosphate 3-epimerase [Bryobacteraceae bacterium]|jgi:ribulose-phosphate 3-epimerase
MIEILPSILAADFARLGEQVALVEAAGARMVHVDVMDGHFVPNLTLGPPLVQSLRKATKLSFDVHLMIEDPDLFAPLFIEAGGNHILVHQEACRNLDRTLHLIREHGGHPGVVINPATPVSMLDEVLDLVDSVLVMSVNPGFGGQEFIPNSLNKVRQLAARRKERRLQFAIEIDGGITLENVADAIHAGVDWVVAGTSIFHTVNPGAAFEQLSRTAREASTVPV